MALIGQRTSPLQPANKVVSAKAEQVARTDTTALTLFTLPKGAIPIYVIVEGTTASDAGTSATLSVGKIGTANFFGSFDVKTSGATTILSGSNMGTKLTADTPIQATYAETGIASTTGGPWTVVVGYLY